MLALAAGLLMGGCSDPTTIGRFKATPVTNIILDNLGVVEEKPAQFAAAREPKADDLLVDEQEYVIRPGDVIDVGIMDLFETGLEWRNRLQVSETGRVTIPEIGTFQASGRTELELTDDIKDLLSPHVIKDPTVSVVVIASTEKVFSISGAISTPGRYPLPEPDFRIYEALASAGGIAQVGVDYAYVLRTVSESEIEAYLEEGYQVDEYVPAGADELPPIPTVESPGAEGLPRDMDGGQALPVPFEEGPVMEDEPVIERPEEVEEPMMDDNEDAGEEEISPDAEKEDLLESISPLSIISEAADGRGVEVRPIRYNAVEEDSRQEMVLANSLMMTAAAGDDTKQFKAVRVGSKFKLVPTEEYEEPDMPEGDGRPGSPARPEERRPARTGWRMGTGGDLQEVIRIDLKALQSGDLTQNIVIRPGDHILVQFNEVGIYYVWGQVGRPGPYTLQGEKVTLKEAIAGAGALTPFAYPERCDITRRIGNDKEVTCRINLKKLLEGSQPNIYIKPHDIINVGSHPMSRWLAVIRQSFRATYGFGFVYDRNLADKDLGN